MTGKQIVDRVVLNSGERYDFQLINIDGQCDSLDRRQIRISTLADSFDDGTSPENINYFHSDAILECITDELKDGENPVCQIQNCSATTPCQVLNCPFKQYPKAVANVTCINPHEFDSAKLLPDTLQKTDPDDEIFLNIGGIESDSNFHFNNIRMKPANYPPYEEILQGGNLGNVAEVCQADCGDKKECECFKPLVLQPKNLTQIVIYNKIDSSNSANVSMGHPIHIHGQHMYVVKVGYSTTDAQDMVDEVNKDITCKNFNCANGDWVNKTRGRTEGYNLVNPAFKDTIYVPYGGYVVLRSIPSNIGWFVMHCHMLIHETEGLMIPLKVGTDEEIGAAVKAHRPKDYPVCPNTATLTCKEFFYLCKIIYSRTT